MEPAAGLSFKAMDNPPTLKPMDIPPRGELLLDLLRYPPKRPQFPGRAVDLWLGGLDDSTSCGEEEGILSSDERARAARFHRAVHRRRFERGRGHLRRILGFYLSVPAGSVAFRYTEAGKPELEADCGLAFNVSHSGSILAVGIGGGALGVDVEILRPVPDLEAVAASVFSAAERCCLGAGESGLTIEAFFRLWTAKEAVMKGLGRGFLSDPRGVELKAAPFGFRATLGKEEVSEWSVVSFSVAPKAAGGGALGAVAVPGPPPEVRAFSIPGAPA